VAKTRNRTFNETIAAAIKDFEEHGYDSIERVQRWEKAIEEAARRTMTPESELLAAMRKVLEDTYRRLITRKGILRFNPGVEDYMLRKATPKLREQLAQRIVAAAQLIKLNRDEQIALTLRRFSGLATSIPKGGTDLLKSREIKEKLTKPLTSLPFRDRRVLIDQGHKLTASLSEIVAQEDGAIAGIWHSHWRESGYDYREDHKERDKQVYYVPDSWAMKQGFIKRVRGHSTDDITKPGEEVFCRCYYQWLYNLNELPRDALTKKGMAAMRRTT